MTNEAETHRPPALHRALELREEGKSQRAIAHILEAEGVPRPGGGGAPWSQTAVARLFRRFEQAPPAASAPAPPAPTPPAFLAADVDALAAERQRWKELLAAQGGQNEERARLLEREERSETRRRLLRREEWRGRLPVLLAGLLLGLVLGGGGAWLYFTYGPPGQEFQRYHRAWNAMTEEQRKGVNKQLQGK